MCISSSSLLGPDVEQCPETIAASATSDKSRAHMCTDESIPSAKGNYVSSLFACILVASVVLNIFLGAALASAYRRHPWRQSTESVSIGVQSQCTYTRWCKTPRFM